MEPGFIVDANVGRLARRLRMLGYDTRFINDIDDDELIRIAWREGRILLTRDTGIMERRIVTTGRITAVLITSDEVKEQIRQVIDGLCLEPAPAPFTRCMECNAPLMARDKEAVYGLVPPYVYRTQNQFMQCPRCERVYWQGTHWAEMARELASLKR